MSNFTDLVLDDIINKQKKSNFYYTNPFVKLRSITGNIATGQTVGISGKPTSGKASFLDMIYIIKVFSEWRKIEENKRPPLKILYWGFKKPLKHKLKKWTCLYLYLKYDLIIDIPTLNNNVNKLYDLNKEHILMIEEAGEFFNELLSSGVLIYIERPETPSQIYLKVSKELDKLGHLQNNKFIFNKSNTVIINIIEDVNRIAEEYDGDFKLNSAQLKNKLIYYLNELKQKEVLNVLILPVKQTSNYSNYKPNISDLAEFQDSVDLGYVLYNPATDVHKEFEGYKLNQFINFKGSSRLRILKVVSNAFGPDNVVIGMLFLGECGYLEELPRSIDLEAISKTELKINKIDDNLKKMKNE